MLERQGYFPVTSPRHGKDHVRCLKQKKLPSRRFRTLLYCLFQILNPKFLVFHLPGADRVPRCYASRSHSVYLSVSQARAGKSPGSLALEPTSATSSGYTGKKPKMACRALISGEYARKVKECRKGQSKASSPR